MTHTPEDTQRQRIWVFGGTGLVGSALLKTLAVSAGVDVLAWTRRPFNPPLPAPLTACEVSLSDPSTWPTTPVDTAFCCLGTTIATAGSQAAFVAVDETLVLALAAHAKAHGCRHFLVVSAMGANARSAVFYNRVKGRTEDALKAMGFAQLTILRPSLLDGDRAEHRPGERLGLVMARLFAPLIPMRYRAVHANAVAQCMAEISRQQGSGVKIIESDLIQTHHRL